ncbi:glycosyltransferase [Schaalia sp. ZJ405]|nr:glycosyltransferase [Schaalia sp. ZJ405]
MAAVIPAHNVGHDVATTVRSCRAIPGVDLLIVVDDGSEDDTGRAARAAGAVVVRHSVYRGRASAIETGVKVAAMRDRADWPPRHLLILSADLGESAVEATLLVQAVTSGQADCATAVLPHSESTLRTGHAQRVARSAIFRATGWESFNPLSSQRCVTREAISVAMPFMQGYGLEVAMTIDILEAGLSAVEVPCSFVHSGADKRIGDLNRPARLTDSLIAAARRRLRRSRRAEIQSLCAPGYTQGIGTPYPRPASERNASERAVNATN